MREIEIKVTKFQAWGGKVFDDRSECEAYEAANPHLIFVGLTAGQIEAALAAPADGSDMWLAEAFCAIGDRIRVKLSPAPGADPSAGFKKLAAAFHSDMAADLTAAPRSRGEHAFLAGLGGIVPDDLRADKAASEEWLDGWDAESVKRRAAA